MFDFGFWELAIIAVIALVVVGPDKMPALARKAGVYAGKATKLVNRVKREIKDELNADELKSQLTIKDEGSVFSQVFKEAKSSLYEIEQEGKGISDILAHTKKDSPADRKSVV